MEEERLCNKSKGDYCGPYYFPESWKSGLSTWFNRPCRRHDHNYSKNKGRIKSDVRFYKGMFRHSGMNPLKHIVALIFFVMVLLFGWISYNSGEKGSNRK